MVSDPLGWEQAGGVGVSVLFMVVTQEQCQSVLGLLGTAEPSSAHAAEQRPLPPPLPLTIALQ